MFHPVKVSQQRVPGVYLISSLCNSTGFVVSFTSTRGWTSVYLLRPHQYLENLMRVPSPRCQLQMVTNQLSHTYLPRSLSKSIATTNQCNCNPRRLLEFAKPTTAVNSSEEDLTLSKAAHAVALPAPPPPPNLQPLTFPPHLSFRLRNSNVLHKRTQP